MQKNPAMKSAIIERPISEKRVERQENRDKNIEQEKESDAQSQDKIRTTPFSQKRFQL